MFNLCTSVLLIIDGDRDVLGTIVGSEVPFCSRCAGDAFVAAFEAALEVDAIAVALLWLWPVDQSMLLSISLHMCGAPCASKYPRNLVERS